MTGEENAFLIDLCKTYKIKELPLLAATEQCITGPLKTLYKKICAERNSAGEAQTEAKKLQLFIIVHKIENGKRNLTMVTNSTAFPAGLPATYSDEDDRHYHVVIIENTDAKITFRAFFAIRTKRMCKTVVFPSTSFFDFTTTPIMLSIRLPAMSVLI